MNATDEAPALLECGHPASPHGPNDLGYGRKDRNGPRLCYSCCAERVRASMIETGRADLYLSGGVGGTPVEVTDWPGHLRFPARGVRSTRIGYCLDGRIAYFTGPDGKRWSARGPGLGMYARCRRLAK